MSRQDRQERVERAAAEIVVKAKPAITIEHEFELLTPIFGGAAISRTAVSSDNDRDNPLRVSAIRGQLRFWWRAARAGQFRTLEELSDHEAFLWGKGTEPGVVSLRLVSSGAQLSEEHYFEQDRKGRWRPKRTHADLAYMGFALQPTQNEVGAGIGARPAVKVSGTHTLVATLRSDERDAREEAEAAIWAWAHFGGIGGRTRRGFGAVSTGDEGATNMLQSKLIIDTNPPYGVPSLAPSAGAVIRASNRASKAREAWSDLARAYHSFRQGKDVGRNPPQHGKWAGRSRWPEPDVIRHDLQGRFVGASEHQQRITEVSKAPRAQFGMPIIFHFIEKLSDHTLKPCDHERYASPLVLRPVGKASQARGIALVLGNRPSLDDLDGGVVFDAGRRPQPVKVRLTSDEAARLRDPLGTDIDPLQSFLAFLASRDGR